MFSLGCVIVFAATGVGPFGDGPPASMLYRIVHAEPALGQVPDGLRELAAACLVKAPGRGLRGQLRQERVRDQHRQRGQALGFPGR